MSGYPKELFRKWKHSFEEDSEGIAVYRPVEYRFPRARGRAGLEFKSDGEFIDSEVGPGDAPREIGGRWNVEGPMCIRVNFSGDIRGSRLFEILQCNETVLKIRPLSTPF